jgi:Replication-relaxation
LFLRHTLAVNDFLIAVATLSAITPDISVHDIKHDLTLKRTRATVIPDSWIDFRLNQKTQLCIWLEMDMGTMDQKPFRKKISELIDFSRQSYEQVFGTPSLTIVFATTAGQGHFASHHDRGLSNSQHALHTMYHFFLLFSTDCQMRRGERQ